MKDKKDTVIRCSSSDAPEIAGVCCSLGIRKNWPAVSDAKVEKSPVRRYTVGNSGSLVGPNRMRETGRSDVGSGPWTKTSAFSPSHGSDKALEMGNVLRRGAGRVFGRSLATCGLTRGPAPLPFPTRPFPHLILSHTTPLPFPHLILSHTSIYLHQIPLTMEALSSLIPPISLLSFLL